MILLVDDNTEIRGLFARYLRSRGFMVLEAVDGAAALEYFQANPQAIDLIVIDVDMPQLRGPDLAKAVWQLAPRLPVIYVSGSSTDEHAAEHVAQGRAKMLDKPIMPPALVEVVQSTLLVGR